MRSFYLGGGRLVLAMTAGLAGLSCDAFLKDNPDYCKEGVACPDGRNCDLMRHRCSPIDPNDSAVTAISPAVGKHDGTTPITVQGRNFMSGMTVQVNGVAVPTMFKSANELQFTLPQSTLCGQVPVTVTNLNGQPVPGRQKVRYRDAVLAFDMVGFPIRAIGARAVAASPLDDDELADLIVSDTTPALNVYHNKDNLSFTAVKPSMPAPSIYTELAGLIDKSKTKDILMLSSSGLSSCQATSEDPYTCNPTILSKQAVDVFAFADLDKNGTGDAISFSYLRQFLTVNMNGSTKPEDVFNFNTIGPSGAATSLAVGDFDGDGDKDVAVALPSNSVVVITYGDGNGGFRAEPDKVYVPSKTQQKVPSLIAALDVNEDGQDELIVVTELNSETDFLVGRHSSSGFAFTSFGPPPAMMDSIALADLDCDGLKDVVLYKKRTANLTVYRNLGNGAFTMTGQNVPLQLPVTSVTFANMNTSDNKVDFAAIELDTSVLIFQNNSH